MTESAASHSSFRIQNRTDAAARSASMRNPAPRARLSLPAWLPRPILQRGGIATRDDARALRDLQAARDRSDW